MTDELDYGAPRSDGEIGELAELLSHAFGFPPADTPPWFERAKHENIRVVRRARVPTATAHGASASVCAGLLEIPMGQYFGGRSVSTMGVAGVGVAPEARGRGLGARMMVAMLREARARGFAISTLYPASVVLYRRAGYERAGARFTVTLDPRECEIARVPEMTIAEIDGAPEAVVALYAQTARRSHGYLDRGQYVWSRVTKPRGLLPKVFAVSHGTSGALEGYVAVAHVSSGIFAPTSVTVTDLAATTARAAQAILRFLVEYRSLAGAVKWGGSPSDLFTNLLPERHVAIELDSHFMVRILDLGRAFTARGWPGLASGAVTFELSDGSMPENSGRYTVALNDGAARVETGSSGAPHTVAISERGLAALYTGHVAPHALVELGWLSASDDACAHLDTWFSGPMPTMRDHF